MEENVEELHRRIAELQKEVAYLNQQLKQDNQFGLHWIDVPEAFDAESENKIPVLEEVPELAIKNDDGKPTHILIEGDNYHALTCLNYTHHGKVDVIYIDPPYNTGSDGFTYHDKRFLEEYPDGTKIPSNHPLRHSAWLSFMEKRLNLAKELLSDKGVIFISIDDNELSNLKLLCDSVFDGNFVEIFSWVKTETPANLSLKSKKAVEYILCYTRKSLPIKFRGLLKESISNNGLMNQTNSVHLLRFPKNVVDTKLDNGIYKRGLYGTSSYQIELLEDTEVKDGYFVKDVLLKGKFKWGQDYLNKSIEEGTKISIKTIAFSPSYEKSEYEPEVPWNLINKNFGVDTNETASAQLKNIMGDTPFKYPKPISLIKYLANFTDGQVFLDFFAGSGTTLHATMQLNAEDGGHRQCILCQINEGDICRDVTYERNRRVIQGYTDSKGKFVDGLGNSLKYYRTAFVGKNGPKTATDEDKLTLAKKAGCLLSLAENTLYETSVNDYYQFFTDGQGHSTCIYFQEDYSRFEEFRQKVIELESEQKTVYVFCWADGAEFASEFEFERNVEVKSIPQPILNIYKSLNA
ncbi:MAG: hypothetical protein IJS20_03950 [Bacteroidales bacterium]|nr:hypothetical protein [Bacteroidales bacterium]